MHSDLEKHISATFFEFPLWLPCSDCFQCAICTQEHLQTVFPFCAHQLRPEHHLAIQGKPFGPCRPTSPRLSPDPRMVLLIGWVGKRVNLCFIKLKKTYFFKLISRCKGRYLMKLGTDIHGLVFSMSFCIPATVHRKRYFAPAAREITLQNPLQRHVEELYHSIYLHLQHLQCWANRSMNW